MGRRREKPTAAPATSRPPAPLVPGEPPAPADPAEVRSRLLSGASGRPDRIRPPAQLPEPLYDCDLFLSGWWCLLGEAALAVHSAVCRRPLRGPVRPPATLGELSGVSVAGVLSAPIAAGPAAFSEAAAALEACASVPAGVLAESAVPVVDALVTLGVVVRDRDQVWCACSPVTPPPGGRLALPAAPIPAEVAYPVEIAGFSMARAFRHRTDRSSAAFWAFLPAGAVADTPADQWTAQQWEQAVTGATEVAMAVGECGRGVVSVRPADITVEVDPDDPQAPPLPAGVRLALTVTVDWPLLGRAGMLPEPEVRALVMGGVAVCDSSSSERDIAAAAVALTPAGRQDALRQHLDRLGARGRLRAALEGRSLTELAGDAGCTVHGDDLARGSLAQRTDVVAYTSATLLLHECSEPELHVSPFGVADGDDEDWLKAAAALTGLQVLTDAPGPDLVPRLATVHAALDYDRAVLEAGGRWPDRYRPRPATEPGDAVALRTFGVDQQVHRWATWCEEMNPATAFAGREPMADQAVEMLLLAPLLAQAVPFFLPSAVAAGVADSLPPDTQTLATLTLPHPVCLLALGAPMLLAPRSAHWSPHLVPDLAAWDDVLISSPGVRRRGPTATAAAAVSTTRLPLLAALWRFGALVDGVVLISNPDGGVHDEVLWCVRVPDPDDATATLGRAVLPGGLRQSVFADPVANLATVLAVAEWQQPTGAPPGVPGSSEFRRAVRRGSFPDAERSGGPGGVRVLQLPDPATAAAALTESPEPAVPTGRHVRTHLRRRALAAGARRAPRRLAVPAGAHPADRRERCRVGLAGPGRVPRAGT